MRTTFVLTSHHSLTRPCRSRCSRSFRSPRTSLPTFSLAGRSHKVAATANATAVQSDSIHKNSHINSAAPSFHESSLSSSAADTLRHVASAAHSNTNSNSNANNNNGGEQQQHLHIAPAAFASENHFDLVVIGSGPAGQKCAINAAKMKKRVAIIDKKEMYGGVCIHTGTIPSKTFREAVLYLTGYRQRGFYGKGTVSRDDVSSVDILDRVQKVEAWEMSTILDQLQRNRILCIQGTAKFLDAHHLEVKNERMTILGGNGNHTSIANATNHHSSTPLHQSTSAFTTATKQDLLSFGVNMTDDKSGSSTIQASSSMPSTAGNTHIIHASNTLICCGTRPARSDLYPFSSPLVFDADQILKRETWDSVRHLIVIGAGVIAMEYASMFNALPGCRVTIIDEKPTVLDFIDSEVVQTLRHIMGRSGATFRLGERVVQVEAQEQLVRVHLESGKVVSGDALFYAVGRQANSDTLNIEATGVTLAKRGLIPVNEFFQTNVPNIYAAGDVIGFPALASTAMEQGRLAASHMFASGRPMKPVFPYGIYTIPEISVIGASEQELTKGKIPYEIGIAKFEETAKGQMIGGQHIDGFLKILFCPNTHKLLGCAAIGESAVEIIHIGQSVMHLGGTIDYFRDSVFNYPTMAESYRVAALDGLNRLNEHMGQV